MPVDLQQRHVSGEINLSPYSDCRARDLLLLELLCFEAGFPDEEAPPLWDWHLIERRLEETELAHVKRYFQRCEILDSSEQQRICSQELTTSMCVSLPPTCRVVQGRMVGDGKLYLITASLCEGVRNALWITCQSLWMLLGITVARQIGRLFVGDTQQPSFILWATIWIVGVTVMLSGIVGTSIIAFGTESVYLVKIGRIGFPLPVHRSNSDSRAVRRLLVIGRLAVGVLLLAVANVIVQ
jgi:hypothetical protein